MEIYQLEHFVAVVEEHSFTRAAARVFRTQGAVSVAVRKLEEEIGVSLIVRDSHECTLTEAGHALLAYAKGIIELRDKMQRRMSDYKTLATGRLSIAAHESAAEYLLRAPLAAFHMQYPTIRLEARLCDGHEIAQLVFGREVDLGFGIRQASLHGLRSELLHSDPLVLIAALDHRLSRCSRLSILTLSEERMFMHSRHSPMTVTVRRLFAEHNVPLNVAAELWSFEMIKEFVRMGRGVAIVPMSVAESDVARGAFAAIPVEELVTSRSIEVIHREDESLLPAPAALLELLRAWDWGRHANAKAFADIMPSGEPVWKQVASSR